MNNLRAEKLQHLLITQLLKRGRVNLLLPDGITLEIGITQEGKDGSLEKTDDYCYVVASRNSKAIALDSYNLGLQFTQDADTMVYDSETEGDDGKILRRMDVI